MIGLNPEAWELWTAYRRSIRKAYKSPASIELAQKKLASFGEYQMQVVEQSIERAWTGLFELPKRQIKEMKESQSKELREARELESLSIRADKIRFRLPYPNESARDYRIDLEAAERRFEDAQYRSRAASAPRSLKDMLQGMSK